jgi:DNA repair protein RAD16
VHNKYFCGPKAKRTAKQLKRELTGTTNKRQSKEVIKKGLRTLRVDVDDEEDEAEVECVASTHSGKKNTVSGPMSVYRELMMDAGRKVHGRWERKRSRDSSESDVDVSAGDGNDESTTSDDETVDDLPTDPKRFLCQHCEFPLLRYAFCPKTGQQHVLSTNGP